MIAGVLMEGSSDGRIPPRPILERVKVEQRKRIHQDTRRIVEELLAGRKARAQEIAEELAAHLLERTRAAQDGTITPSNAASTIARKGVDAPLRTPGASAGGDRLYKQVTARVLPR